MVDPLTEAARRIDMLEADLAAAGAHIEGLSDQVSELQAELAGCPFHGRVGEPWVLP